MTSLDWFVGGSQNFNEEGLFSISIFGKPGDDRRNVAFSYIDIKAEIFHPIIYRVMTKMRAFYQEIMSSKAYAVWDKEAKDFLKSDPINGQTGYQFFINHWKDIKYEHRPSVSREQSIQLIDKYKDRATTSKIVVLPAGLRDLEISSDGRFQEDEINTLYRSILSLSNAITKEALKNNPQVLDGVRYSIQNKFNQIYDLIESMIEGKRKLMMGKWARRKIHYGTRNVITAIPSKVKELDDPSNVSISDCVVGMYQHMKATTPITLANLRNGFLSKVFLGPNAPATLINKKTLQAEQVVLKPEYYDSWMTNEGLEKVLTLFQDVSIRHNPLEIAGYYVGLIYKGPDNTFKLMQNIDELEPGRSKNNVYPLTFCELMYISVYKVSAKYPAFLTRYPITGLGSIYPSTVYMKSTVVGIKMKELDDNWQPIAETAFEFPVTGQPFVDSLSPSLPNLARLGGDFDGDIA